MFDFKQTRNRQYKVMRNFMVSFCFLFVANISYSQENAKTKILGTWLFSKVEMLRSFEDSTSIKEKSKGMMVVFVDSTRYTAQQKTDTGVKELESGEYSISPDGKLLKQGDTEAQIILLNEKELVLRVDRVFVLYFKREERNK
jgi:hypothetical protein